MQELTIISGGQTGADRAALDFAIRHGIPHGGRCPRGRKAEDGALDEIYQLEETESAKYEERTRLNVFASDGTVVFSSRLETTGGTALTLAIAERSGKPCLHLNRECTPSAQEAGELLAEFLVRHEVRRLNVAGPRASQDPSIAAYVDAVLQSALASPLLAQAD